MAKWFSKRALLLHLALLAIVPGCLIAGWWQYHRALQGNFISWGYTFEWPAFAIIAIWAWRYLIIEDPHKRQARIDERERLRTAKPIGADLNGTIMPAEPSLNSDDPLDVYNYYLAQLAKQKRENKWRKSKEQKSF